MRPYTIVYSVGAAFLAVVGGTLPAHAQAATLAVPISLNALSIISDVEVNRPVSSQRPGLVAFVRAEPIWNWDSLKAPGISGFDFRLYGGLRFSLSKPAYDSGIENLRKQIMESPEKPSQGNSPTSFAPDGNGIRKQSN